MRGRTRVSKGKRGRTRGSEGKGPVSLIAPTSSFTLFAPFSFPQPLTSPQTTPLTFHPSLLSLLLSLHILLFPHSRCSPSPSSLFLPSLLFLFPSLSPLPSPLSNLLFTFLVFHLSTLFQSLFYLYFLVSLSFFFFLIAFIFPIPILF